MPIASSLLNKPRLVKKLRDFYDYVNKNDGKVGTKTRGIDLNFNNACNLRCKYCFTNSPKGDHVKEYLDIGAIKRLADEADELGYFEFDLQGGELLLQPKKLFEVLEAIKPERFYMYLTTNGPKDQNKPAIKIIKTAGLFLTILFMVESLYAFSLPKAIAFLHISVFRTAATFGCNPSDILGGFFNITGLTVDTILRVYYKFFFLNFIHTYRTVPLGRFIVLL